MNYLFKEDIPDNLVELDSKDINDGKVQINKLYPSIVTKFGQKVKKLSHNIAEINEKLNENSSKMKSSLK